MNVGKMTMEGVIDIKVENESYDKVDSERDLYTDHVIKEEMVIGPVVLQVVDVTYCHEERNVWGEHNYCRIQNEDQPESSLVIERSEWNVFCEHNYFQHQNEHEAESSRVIERSDVPVLKQPKLKTTEEETDQDKPQKVIKEDNTEGIISKVDTNKNSSINIKTNLGNNKKITHHNLRKRDQKGISENVLISNNCGKKEKLETTDEETDQVKPQKVIKEDNTEGIISNVNFNKNSSTNIKTKTIFVRNNCYELRKCKQMPGILNYLFICNECGKRFRKKYELEEHVVGHKKELSCSHCDIETINPYSCFCGYTCKRKGSLIIHLRSHTGEKPYACTYCDYKCHRKRCLTIHLRIHTGVKPFSCSYCHYKSRSKGRLSIHLRTHTGHRPYPCSYCAHKCYTKGELTAHMRTHTGEKPHACPRCDYKCKTKHHLLLHNRIHTGEKPYSCTDCDYKTAHKKCLDMHLLKHFTPQIVKEAFSMIRKTPQ